MPVCAACGVPLAEQRKGRPRRWCSDACRKHATRAKTPAGVFPSDWHRARHAEDLRRELDGVRSRLAEILPAVDELRAAERVIVAELRRLR